MILFNDALALPSSLQHLQKLSVYPCVSLSPLSPQSNLHAGTVQRLLFLTSRLPLLLSRLYVCVISPAEQVSVASLAVLRPTAAGSKVSCVTHCRGTKGVIGVIMQSVSIIGSWFFRGRLHFIGFGCGVKMLQLDSSLKFNRSLHLFLLSLLSFVFLYDIAYGSIAK